MRDAELARLRMIEHLVAVEQTLRGEWAGG
jgi:hypothetical protein